MMLNGVHSSLVNWIGWYWRWRRRRRIIIIIIKQDVLMNKSRFSNSGSCKDILERCWCRWKFSSLPPTPDENHHPAAGHLVARPCQLITQWTKEILQHYSLRRECRCSWRRHYQQPHKHSVLLLVSSKTSHFLLLPHIHWSVYIGDKSSAN